MVEISTIPSNPTAEMPKGYRTPNLKGLDDLKEMQARADEKKLDTFYELEVSGFVTYYYRHKDVLHHLQGMLEINVPFKMAVWRKQDADWSRNGY